MKQLKKNHYYNLRISEINKTFSFHQNEKVFIFNLHDLSECG